MDDLLNTLNPTPARPGKVCASDVSDDDDLAVTGDAAEDVRQLRANQRKALSAIMTGKGYTQAATAAGVSRRTVYHWAKNDPAFKAALANWAQRMDRHAIDELNCAVAAAARTFGHAAATNWHAAAILLRNRGLLAAQAQSANQGAAQPEPGNLQSELAALPEARRQEIEKHIRELIATPPGTEPEYMPELRALQERMVAEEAAAVATEAAPVVQENAEGST